VLSDGSRIRYVSQQATSTRKTEKPDMPDIDALDRNNPLMCTMYVNDIYSYWRHVEVRASRAPHTLPSTHGAASPASALRRTFHHSRFRMRGYDAQPDTQTPADYMSDQTDINDKMRAILIDWLVEVHLKFKLMPETLFLTTNLIDRYLAVEPVSRKNLQVPPPPTLTLTPTLKVCLLKAVVADSHPVWTIASDVLCVAHSFRRRTEAELDALERRRIGEAVHALTGTAVLGSAAGGCDGHAAGCQVRGDLGARGARLCVHLRQGVQPPADSRYGATTAHTPPFRLVHDTSMPQALHTTQQCIRRAKDSAMHQGLAPGRHIGARTPSLRQPRLPPAHRPACTDTCSYLRIARALGPLRGLTRVGEELSPSRPHSAHLVPVP
jgi:hypothetical protein